MGGSSRTATSQERRLAPHTASLNFLCFSFVKLMKQMKKANGMGPRQTKQREGMSCFLWRRVSSLWWVMAAGPLAAHPPINQLIIHSLIYLGCSLSLSSSIQSTKEVSWLIERMEEES